MPRIPMHRSAASLIEVLVAIFVMAIGMLALLTLFPIGALRMAYAIQQERCAQSAALSTSYAILQDVRNDPLATKLFQGSTQEADAFLNPTLGLPAPYTLPDADPIGPSYPLFIDPIGWQNASGADRDWVGGAPGILRRQTPSYAMSTPIPAFPILPTADVTKTFRWFSLWDDVTYDNTNEGVALSAGANVIRDSRYSWAYVCQRPRAGDPTTVNCTAVVYNRRPLTLSSTLLLQENVCGPRINPLGSCTTVFNVDENSITVDFGKYSPGPFNAVTGDWLMDATPDGGVSVKQFETPVPPAPPVFTPPRRNYVTPHAFFYRIVGVTDLGNSVIKYEVAGPLRGFGTSGQFPGTAIFFEGVAEVFEKGISRHP